MPYNTYGHIFLILFSGHKYLFFEGGFAYWQMPFVIGTLAWSCSGSKVTIMSLKPNHHFFFPVAYKLALNTVSNGKSSQVFWATAALLAWTFGLPKAWLKCNILNIHTCVCTYNDVGQGAKEVDWKSTKDISNSKTWLICQFGWSEKVWKMSKITIPSTINVCLCN